MLCEKCHQQQATVFFTMIVDGEATKRNLCGSCTTEGYPGPAPDFTRYPPGEVTEEMRKVVEYAFVRDFVPPGAPVGGPGADNPLWKHLASADDRFTPEAFQFVLHAAGAALSASAARPGQHVSGRDVCEAFRSLALRELGTSALPTLAGWGFHSTDDIGVVVFRMIEKGILGSRPEDTPEDFHAVYDFVTAFPVAAGSGE